MISLATAKFLLFIALCLGPKYGDNNHTIEIVNKNSYCVWTQSSDGWNLTQIGMTNQHWPANGTDLTTLELNHFSKEEIATIREIKKHNWTTSKNATLNFPNGDVIEKQGTKAFYTVNAGASNQQIYTIMTMENGVAL